MKISAKHMRFGSGFRGIREESGKITEHLQTTSNAKFESQNFVFGTVQNCVDLVDLIKSFPICLLFLQELAKISVDTAENEPLKVFR